MITSRKKPVSKSYAAQCSQSALQIELVNSLRNVSRPTLVAILIDHRGRAAGINCGDSRIYMFSKSKGLVQLSKDQTVAAAILDAVVGMPRLPLQGSFGEDLGNYVGIGNDIAPEFIEIRSIGVDEILVLASDGIWKALDSTFEKILLSSGALTETARRLLAVVNYAGGSDNASFAAISKREVMQNCLLSTQSTPGFLRVAGMCPNGQIYITSPSIPAVETQLKATDRYSYKANVKNRKVGQGTISQSELPIGYLTTPESKRENRKKKKTSVEVVMEYPSNDNGENASG